MTPSLATRLRQIAARRPADAVELHVIAATVAKMERTLEELTAEAAEQAALDARRVPPVLWRGLRVIEGGTQ
jgi:hypothetical protein